MRRFVRTLMLLPTLVLLLVTVPALLLSLNGKANVALALAQPGTVPVPTATPTATPRPTATHVFVPTATPVRHSSAPAATPVPSTEVDANAVSIEGSRLKLVIGDRLNSTIYGYTTNGWLYRTPDNGQTWELVTREPAVDHFVMSPADPFTLYSGAPLNCARRSARVEPIYRSEDGGGTWLGLLPLQNLQPLLAHPTDPKMLLAAGCDGIYVSDNGGGSWQVKANAGESALWQEYVAVNAKAAYAASEFASSQLNWDHLYVFAHNANNDSVVGYSGDIGDTWGVVTAADSSRRLRISALAVDANVAGRLWIATREGVYSTDDLGSAWSLDDIGLATVLRLNGRQPALTDLLHHSSGRLILGTVRGVFVRPDVGLGWSQVLASGYTALNVTNMLFTDSNPNTLWLNTTKGVFTYQLP